MSDAGVLSIKVGSLDYHMFGKLRCTTNASPRKQEDLVGKEEKICPHQRSGPSPSAGHSWNAG